MTTAREDTNRLAELLHVEHHAMADFLIALAVFDRERRWMELGYASLFSFLTRELRLSAGAAQYRKTAAELIQRLPEVEAALRRGDLCLSSVVEVSKVVTLENAAEVLPRFFGKSSRDAAFVAASLRPVEDPPRRDFVITPVRAAPTPALAADAPRAGRANDDGSSSPDGAALGPLRAPETLGVQPPDASGPSPVRPSPAEDRLKIRPLDGERARMNLTVSRRLLDKLAAARDALSHSHPGATEDAILELGLDLIIERHRKRRGIGAKPRSASSTSTPTPTSTPIPTPIPTPIATATATATSPSTATSLRNRHVPAAVWRAVWERDGGCCAWPLENGGRCGSTYQLELDHVEGFALGADTTVEECRLLCRPHQDASARRLYGDDLMNFFTRPKGRRCSEPVSRWRAARRGETGHAVRIPRSEP